MTEKGQRIEYPKKPYEEFAKDHELRDRILDRPKA